MSNHDEKDLLTQTLRERAEGVGGGSLDLESVRGRARGIKRRRNAVRGAVAAMVATLAVPGGLAVNTALQTPGDERPDNNIATGTPSPSTLEERRLEGPTALTLDGLPQGPAPAIPYLTVDPADQERKQLVTPDGTVELDDELGPVQAAVSSGDGWTVLAYPGPRLHRLDAEGQIVGTEQYVAGQQIAVSHDGSQLLYVLIDPTDDAQLVTAAPTTGSTEPINWRLPARPAVTPVGFVDDDTVVFTTTDDRGASVIYTATPGEEPQPLDSPLLGASAAGDGVIYGFTRVDEIEPSVCSAAVDPRTGTMLWENCDYSLPKGALSPSGGLLLANPGYVDGYGALSVSVLDASTGKPLVDYEQTSRDGQVTELDSAWETDQTFVSSIADGEDFALVRYGVDGGSELAIEPIKGTPFEDMPFWLMQ
jgi:outer membrane protein assembly factor BamB